ncbi:MAG TPA: DUF5693 family protein [Synergistaceae bacterium]|nr:hypothetical protein [Synergistaceae bacterium]NLL40704.1 hypothetical protein [Synergistaceae bacterium]HPX03781.1 DUF5693 family protein [Synergistaceae bacterium]HQA54703.1 DUF5693 family protein [Synergistaceae bacterium]
MFNMKARNIVIAAMAVSMLLAAWGVIPRVREEQSNKTVAFVMEFRDLTTLAVQSGSPAEAIWKEINGLGVIGLSVSEFTGEEITLMNPLPLRYGTAGQFGLSSEKILSDRAVILTERSSKYTEPVISYIKLKMPASEIIYRAQDTAIILPGSTSDFKVSSFLPDFYGLDFCSENDIPVMFRPGPCPASDGQAAAVAFDYLTSEYPGIKNVTASGMIMAGYPDFKPLADVMKRKGITFSQTEFVKQVGAAGFAKAMYPMVIPLHSLTRDEVISRSISRLQIAERFVRAIHERSVRLIMVRPYDLNMGNRMEIFKDDLRFTGESIKARGYDFGWPSNLNEWAESMPGALACGIVLVFCGWFYTVRLNTGGEGDVSAKVFSLLIFASLLVAAGIFKFPILARICGGLCGAAAAAEAALSALESHKKPLLGAVKGLFIVTAGGLAIASFYGTTMAALRLTPFSGVKLTLLLPPLLVLVHDLRRKVHPESLPEIIGRPAIWGELFLIGILMLAMLIMALRSDNVSNVPAWEVAFREFMERALLVRPRTKEFLIGYPALVLYWYTVRKDYIPGCREALRIVSVLAFSSAVNTFCHFHTLLSLSVIRTLNGWWLGILLGVIAVAILNYVIMPLHKKLSGDVPN